MEEFNVARIRPVLGCYEHGDEPLSSIEVGHFFTIWLTVRLSRWSSVELVKVNIYVCLLFIFLKFIVIPQKKHCLFSETVCELVLFYGILVNWAEQSVLKGS